MAAAVVAAAVVDLKLIWVKYLFYLSCTCYSIPWITTNIKMFSGLGIFCCSVYSSEHLLRLEACKVSPSIVYTCDQLFAMQPPSTAAGKVPQSQRSLGEDGRNEEMVLNGGWGRGDLNSAVITDNVRLIKWKNYSRSTHKDSEGVYKDSSQSSDVRWCEANQINCNAT